MSIACKIQMIEDGNLSAVEAFASGQISEVPWMTREVAEEFWGTVNGGNRDEKMVRAARTEELECVEKGHICTSSEKRGDVQAHLSAVG